jgi:hypothetical protein
MKKRAFFWLLPAVFYLVSGSLALCPAQTSSPDRRDLMPTAPEGRVSEKQPEMTDIHDIKPPQEISSDSKLTFFMIMAMAALILAAVITGLYFFLKKRKLKAAAGPSAVPPDQVTLGLLDELADGTLSDGKAFYFRLSGILRFYMQARFSFDAPEMTTEELIPRLEMLELDHALKARVKNFLYSSDPIKFADRPADKSAMQQDLEFIKEFVTFTTRKELQADSSQQH